jgi:hypothetical protein
MEGDDTGQRLRQPVPFAYSLILHDADLVWGVIDFVPRTNFPDIRNRSIIISNQGTRMLIPREGNKVRVYIQVNDLLTRATVDDITRDSIMMVSIEGFEHAVRL